MILCPHCKESTDDSSLYCRNCGEKIVQIIAPPAQSADLARMELSLKELKLLKEKGMLAKTEVLQNMQAVHAEYTEYMRQLAPKLPGGGKFWKAIRFTQTVSQDGQKRSLAETLATLEGRKQELEGCLLELDYLIWETEAAIHRYKNS